MSLVWLSCYKKLKHEIEDAAKEEQLLLKQQQEVASKAKQSHTAGQKIKKSPGKKTRKIKKKILVKFHFWQF